jgi:tetratricopeptide (TPR) repeat protein
MMKKKYTYLIIIFLIIITCGAFSRVAGNDFINLDDEGYVCNNTHIKSGFNIDSVQWAFTTRYFDIWNPMVWLSFMIDYQLFGLNPGGYHITNLFLHILSTILLFWLFNRMTGAVWRSAFVAVLFAIHPLHVESVAWVAERKDVLSGFFWMLTLCLYVYYTEKPVMQRYILLVLIFILALLSKPMVVTLPVVMMLLDYWPLKRFQSRKSNWILWQVKEKALFFILSVTMIIITIYNPDKLQQELFPLSTRVYNALVTYVIYLEKTFWPRDLAVFYPFPTQIPILKVMGASIIILMISVIAILTAKKNQYLLVGWLWYLITVSPVIGFIQISYSTPYGMADRYTYLPSIGIAVMLSWGIPSLIKSEEKRKHFLFLTAFLVAAILAYLTWLQCGYWKNSLELWNHAINVQKNNTVKAQGDQNLDIYAANAMNAERYRKNEIGIRPETVLYYNRGNAFAKMRQYQLAMEDYNQSIRLQPNFAPAYFNRGNIYKDMGQYQLAIENYIINIQLCPECIDAYDQLGIVHGKMGQYQSALQIFNKVLSLKPNDHTAYNGRGIVYFKLGLYEQAMENLNYAIRIKPDYTDAYNNKALIHLTQNSKVLGCSYARKACSLGVCTTLEAAKSKGDCL